MPDDQVTIDPEFRPSRPDGSQSHRFQAAGVVALVVVAFVLGWFLRSPAPTETEPDATSSAASATSTTGAAETTTTSTTRASTTTATSEPPTTFDVGMPLSEAVPGFIDVITMERWSETGVEVARWRSPQSAPETIASFDSGESSWFEGLDASATWYTLTDAGVLSVYRVAGPDAQLPWSPDLQTVGVRVAASAWHDTAPGQLAWLSCARAPGNPGTLFRLDVTDGSAEPAAVQLVDEVCGEEAATWLAGWGDWGFALYRWDNTTGEERILLDVEGVEIASINDELNPAWFVAGGPNGTIWNPEPPETLRPPFLLSRDGRSRTPVPGLADGDRLEDARWSPDGKRLALTVQRFGADPAVRIVDLSDGRTLTEIADTDWQIGGLTWSSEGRFLVLDRWLCPDGCGSRGPEQLELTFHDTLTNTTTGISLPSPTGGDWWGNVRLTDPATPAELVAHYPLDGNGADLTGHGFDGAIVGPTRTGDRFGTADGAYAFDGENDRIAIDVRPQLESDTLSLAAWIKVPDSAMPRPVAGWRDIVSYGAGGHVLAIHSDGVVLAGLQGAGDGCEFVGSDTVFDGGWHHVAMTRDANWTIRIYVDGRIQAIEPVRDPGSEADTTTSGACAVAHEFGNSIWIGGDPALWEFFRGSIDDVHIYSGTLTEEEIAVLAAATP